MKSGGMNPRFGGPGQHRQNSSNQNNPRPQFPRPPFPKGPQQSRGNGNPNGYGRMPGPFGPMAGPSGQMMGPNRYMIGPVMTPSGPMMAPMMGPNIPMIPPGLRDPSGFSMMMRLPVPGATVPVEPPMYTNHGFPKKSYGKGPQQPTVKSEKDCVQSGKGNRNNENQSSCQNSTFNSEESSNYNNPQFGAAAGTNCGWQGNSFPAVWNYSSPPNQFYYQNSNQNIDPQYYNQDSNQDYCPTYYQNYDESYNECYNQGQPYMQNNYYNFKQEHADADFKYNFNQNGAFNMGSNNAPKNKKRNEMFQKMRTHYCDTCDRSLPSEEALATHISEHKVCGLDECKFTAHPKVVEKHQQMQHFTGLYRRIGSLYTPEDIEKWRKDRKKNYPTPQNVEERRAKQEEMYARGERMRTPNNRFPHNNQQRNGRFPQRQSTRANHRDDENFSDARQPPPNLPAEPPKKWKPVFPPVVAVIEESEERSGVKPFPGTAALLPKDSNFPEKTVASKPDEHVKHIKSSSSLSFLCLYGNSSSEEDSDIEESRNDSTLAEGTTMKNCPSKPINEEMDTSIPEDSKNSLQPELELSDQPLLVTAQQPATSSEGTVSTNDIGEENEMSSDTNDVSILPLVINTPKKDGEFKDVATINAEESNDSSKSLESIAPCGHSSVSETPPSTNLQFATETESSKSVSDPKISESSPKNIPDELNQENESLRTVSDEGKSDNDKSVSDKSTCITASLQQPSDEMNNSNGTHNCSDDSGPEEVPIARDSGMAREKEEENDDGEVEQVANNGGGRKRKRQPRQPAKKLKTEDENQTDQKQPENKNQQQSNKHDKRYENNRPPRVYRHPPVRRDPTLLEKLLSKEICHERNVILQCVRYVVENNYFRNDRSEGGTS